MRLRLLSIIAAFIVLGVAPAATPCQGCSPFQLTRSFRLQRFHFPLNGPEIVQLKPDTRGGAWFVQARFGLDGAQAGYLEPEGGRRILGTLPPVNAQDADPSDGTFCSPMMGGELRCLHTSQYGAFRAGMAAEGLRADRNGAFWTLQDGRLFYFSSANAPPIAIPLGASARQFLESSRGFYIQLNDGTFGEVLTLRTKTGLAHRFMAHATAPWSPHGYLVGISGDGSLWKTDFDGIDRRHPDGRIHSFRFRPPVLAIDQRYRMVPIALAPDGAAWTLAYGRVCRINLQDTMHCADAPPFANRGPRDDYYYAPYVYRFAADGSLWYKFGHEIVRLEFTRHRVKSDELTGDFDLETSDGYDDQYSAHPVLLKRTISSIAYAQHRLIALEHTKDTGNSIGVFNGDPSDAQGVSHERIKPCGFVISRDGTPWFADCSEGIWNADFYEHMHLPDSGRAVAMASLPGENPWVVERFRENGKSHHLLIKIADNGEQIGQRMLDGFVDRLRAGADRNMYLRMKNGSLFRANDGTFEKIANFVSQTFAVDRSGALWIPGDNALIEIRGKKRTAHPLKRGARRSTQPTALAFADDGSLWYGYAGGLCRFDGTERCIRLDSGLEVRQLALGDAGEVWFLAGNSLVGRYRPAPN